MVLMDLDHFTSYYEHYGISAGDRCLQQVASALEEAIQRPGDLVARFDKSGFACVLPETDTLGAVSVAERMRAELASLAIPHAASPSSSTILTMSVGVATRVPTNETEPEDLVNHAERILFDAKRGGRNRVLFG